MTSEPPDRPTQIQRNRERDVRKVGSKFCLWWYYHGTDPGYWFGDPYTEHDAWYPSEEDKAATDWVEHEIVRFR